ncbi:MAG: methylenetetrahydrofolate reductase [NAD(P)H] [Alcaligenaceae bacterium]|nr:methylenetetrahydrofolate reductase [NAD(P)H] [Alcaligenaceae bacterium]
MSNIESTDSRFFSLEYFPPREQAGRERLIETTKKLIEIDPAYISVTYGAGGSTRSGTVETIDMVKTLGCEAVPHLACIGSQPEEIIELLDFYKAKGVRKIVALRGDLPSGMGLSDSPLRYAADLVRLIKEHAGDWFEISVAAYPEMHPQASSFEDDINHFVEKVQAGADTAITQYFYNADAYWDFVNRVEAKGVSIPIIAGIMPMTNYTQLARFSKMCGAEIPRWITVRLESYGDDLESIRAFGHEVVTKICDELRSNGAPGIHFYTLNQAEPVLKIWRELTAK